MYDDSRYQSPVSRHGTDAAGKSATAPESWELVRPGDAALTLRIKKAGEFVLVEERKRRRIISLGVWAPPETVARIRAELAAERAQPGRTKQKSAAAK